LSEGSTDAFEIEATFRDATPRQVESLVMALTLARTAGVSLQALAEYAYEGEMEYTRWLRDMDKEAIALAQARKERWERDRAELAAACREAAALRARDKAKANNGQASASAHVDGRKK
jgi:hypothetical protein